MERRLAAILAADVVGYSRLMATDEVGTLDRLKKVRDETILPRMTAHGGRVFKTMGDGILAEFSSVVGAVEFAVAVQRTLNEEEGAQPEDRRLVWRIGINVGDVIIDGDDIYGDGVNIASRLEQKAQPGGLAISGTVYEQVRNKLDLSLRDLGHQRLKNIADPVHVYDIRLAEEQSPLASGALFDFDENAESQSVLAGGCLCGAVRFEVSQPAISTGFCHCRICQKFTGAPVGVWSAFPASAISFVKGAPKVFRSTPIAERGFCGDCGTSLTYRLMEPAPASYMVIFTATFDNPEEFTPAVHGGIESRMPWMDINDNLPRSRCDESKALRAAWESVGVTEPSSWGPHLPGDV